MTNNNGNGDDFPEYDEAAYFAGRALSSTSFSFSSPRAELFFSRRRFVKDVVPPIVMLQTGAAFVGLHSLQR